MGFPDSSVVKNLPAMQETPIWFLGWEDLLRRDRLPTPVFLGFPVAQLVKNPPAKWETWVQSLGWEDHLKKGKATHSSILFHWPENLCLGRAPVMEKISASPLGYNLLNQPPPLVPFSPNWPGNLQGLGVWKFLLCLKSVKQLLLSLRVKFSGCRNSFMSWESNTWVFMQILCKN